jgi:hypothetical protein
MIDFPNIPKYLIDHLNSLIPEKCPDMSMSEKEIWHYAGQRYVVKLLNEAFEEQNKSIISSSVL